MPFNSRKIIDAREKVWRDRALTKRYFTIFGTTVFVAALLTVGTLVIGGYNVFKFHLGAAQLIDFAPPLIFLVLALALVSLLNFLWFRKSVVQPLAAIETVINSVKKGNYNERIKLESRDEFYEIAETFNETMDKLVVLIQTEDERKKMQEDIIRFLNILSAASEGDLSQKAEVTPDVFGSLADAFNLMVEGLADLIKEVKQSAGEAGTQSHTLAEIIAKLEAGADMQKIEVKTASEAVTTSANSATQIAEKTKVAQQISEDAFTAIKQRWKDSRRLNQWDATDSCNRSGYQQKNEDAVRKADGNRHHLPVDIRNRKSH